VENKSGRRYGTGYVDVVSCHLRGSICAARWRDPLRMFCTRKQFVFFACVRGARY